MQVNTRMTADLPCVPSSVLAPLLAKEKGGGAEHLLADIAELGTDAVSYAI